MRSTHHRRHTPGSSPSRIRCQPAPPIGLTQAPRHAFLPYFQFVAESAKERERRDSNPRFTPEIRLRPRAAG